MKGHYSLLRWIPRLLGLAASAFLATFALDSFGAAATAPALAGAAIHLAPAAIVLALVAVAWRHPAGGGLLFVLCAAAYALAVPARPDWILVISGPLLLVGVLFIWSSRSSRRASSPGPYPRVQ